MGAPSSSSSSSFLFTHSVNKNSSSLVERGGGHFIEEKRGEGRPDDANCHLDRAAGLPLPPPGK